MSNPISRRTARAAAALATCALCVVPLPAATAGPTVAAAEQELGGHRAKGVATPLSLLLFEEKFRITTSPEGEADVAYAEVTSSTGPSGRALASWLWPGPLVGDGLGIVSEGAGLPRTEYPVKSSSQYPSGGSVDGDLGPGLQQRATSSEAGLEARVSIDPVEGGDAGGNDGGEGTDAKGGLPGLPTAGAANEPADQDAAAAEEGPTAGLFDLDGVTSRSRITHGVGEVVTDVVSRVGNVELLAGLIRAESVSSRLTTTSTGTRATATGRTRVVGLEVDGTPVVVGDEGVRVAGEGADSPGSAEVRDLLDQAGVRIWVVPVERTVEKAAASAVASGLVVEVDTTVLRSRLDTSMLDDLFGQLPPDVGTQLQLGLRLAPRLVFRLGYAEAATAGSPRLEIPDLALPEAPAATPDADSPAGDASSGTAGTGGSAGSPSLPAPSAPAAASGGDELPTTPVALAAGPGLPPLYSIPGLLLLAGIALAGALGLYVQKIGGAAFGGAGPCSHGNESGVPDLRKV